MAQQALKVAEETYGANHLNVAISLSILAEFLEAQGQFDQAEPLLRRAGGIVGGAPDSNVQI